MLTQLPHNTDADILNIYSMWEAGLLRDLGGKPWRSPDECKGWPGFRDPTGYVFRCTASNAYIELEE